MDEGYVEMKSRILSKVRKLFIGGRWHIAYRGMGTSDDFTLFPNPKSEFCADPMLIEDNEICHVFCEQFRLKDKKGCIGYFAFEKGKPVNKGIILERPYHLSYPFVFKFNDNYYMIPETSEHKTIEIYIAKRFPDEWEYLGTILRGHAYVDTTVEVIDGVASFVTYYPDGTGFVLEKHILSKDLLSTTLITSINYIKNTGRGAGAYFSKLGEKVRPSQNCERRYGEEIIFNKVVENDKDYAEFPIGCLTVADISVEGKMNIVGIHTYASTNNIEIIDLFAECIDPTYNIGCIIARKIRNKRIIN